MSHNDMEYRILEELKEELEKELEKEVEKEVEEEVNKPRKKVVVVDDIRFHLIVIQERLKNHYKIFDAQNSEELFSVLERNKPDIILLDVNMPEINGFEVLKMLKDNRRYAEIPVIFLTSQFDRKTFEKGIALGVDDILSKPYSDPDLIECIENNCDPEKKAKNKPVILAVDDNLSILKAINYLLKDKYEVRTLPDPLKLSYLLSVTTPDLFLLDCHMPGMSGFELIPVIRAYKQYEETPILFLTSDATADNLYASVNTGACGFLAKPIDEKILHEKIEQHTKGFMMRRRLWELE